LFFDNFFFLKNRAVYEKAWKKYGTARQTTDGNTVRRTLIFNIIRRNDNKGKGKAVPLQAWSGPEGSRKLRFPDYMTMAPGWW
jgi:hypothetical protein